MGKFIKHVGRCALYGRFVVATEASEDHVRLTVETVGGKRIPGFRSPVLTRTEFDALEDSWGEGVHAGDARIVERAMNYLGQIGPDRRTGSSEIRWTDRLPDRQIKIEEIMTYYITSSEYVGPNADERINSHIYRIHTQAPRTNMSHEIRTDGWLGTTNDVAEYAHGQFDSLESARAEIDRILGEDCRELDCSEPTGIDGNEVLFDSARFAVGRRETWGREGTSNWCYEGIKADITADSTDEEIEALADEYESAANDEGFSLHRRTVIGDMESWRDTLRTERDDEDDCEAA